MKLSSALTGAAVLTLGAAGVAEAATPEIIVDSHLTPDQAMSGNHCSADAIFKEVAARQKLITVLYWGMDAQGRPDQKIHQGQIVLDASLEQDVKEIFQVAFDSRFPIHSVIPVSEFEWHDAESMAADNTSGWNYRSVGSGQSCPKRSSDGTLTGSKHASLQAGTAAIDINDVQNPYCHSGICEPSGSGYNPSAPGTLTSTSPIIKVATASKGSSVTLSLCSGDQWSCVPTTQTRTGLGWSWGGRWNSPDYQHLQVSR